MKKYKGIFIGFITGVIITGGVCGYATYNYFASDITYAKAGTEMKVSEALNDLYSKIPDGTTTIEANGTYDVRNIATAIVQNLYTKKQYDDNFDSGFAAGEATVCEITEKTVAGADINNTYICDCNPRFFFVWTNRSDGVKSWICGGTEMSTIWEWDSNRKTNEIYDASQYFTIDSNGIKIKNYRTDLNRTFYIYVIK